MLIDISEYNILLKAKAFQEEHEKKLKLDYVVKHNQNLEQDTNSEDNEEKITDSEKSKPTQVGQGNSAEDLTALIKQIVEKPIPFPRYRTSTLIYKQYSWRGDIGNIRHLSASQTVQHP